MSVIEAIILGIVQGLTEFLPVSSSGHLQIAKEVLGVKITDNLAFDLMLHLATVMATIVVLWREVKSVVADVFSGRMSYALKLLLSAVPVAVVGLVFRNELNAMLASTKVLVIVGSMLIVTALLLWFASCARERKKTEISYRDALIMGVGQAFAAMPGLSRSGTTIATGLLLGNQRAVVAQFSFLMVIVPILGNAFLDVVKGDFGGSAAGGFAGVEIWPLVAGFVAAFAVGCVACRWMIAIVKRAKLVWFAVYCAIVGVGAIVYCFV